MSDTPKRVLNPDMDGVDHINIYTKGKTRLGRLLTNLADIPVTHPTYGTFRTAEGLWYYMKTGCKHESLRALSGFDVKKLGTTFPVVWMANFEDSFKIGVRDKILNHPELKQLFTESTLPFEHYYFYSSSKSDVKPKVIEPKDVRWLTQFFTDLREEWQDTTAQGQ